MVHGVNDSKSGVKPVTGTLFTCLLNWRQWKLITGIFSGPALCVGKSKRQNLKQTGFGRVEVFVPSQSWNKARVNKVTSFVGAELTTAHTARKTNNWMEDIVLKWIRGVFWCDAICCFRGLNNASWIAGTHFSRFWVLKNFEMSPFYFFSKKTNNYETVHEVQMYMYVYTSSLINYMLCTYMYTQVPG